MKKLLDYVQFNEIYEAFKTGIVKTVTVRDGDIDEVFDSLEVFLETYQPGVMVSIEPQALEPCEATVVGIRFINNMRGKTSNNHYYYLATYAANEGDIVLVETQYGPSVGVIECFITDRVTENLMTVSGEINDLNDMTRMLHKKYRKSVVEHKLYTMRQELNRELKDAIYAENSEEFRALLEESNELNA